MCAGLLYTYLAYGTKQSDMQGAFRALTRGYNHWASGRLDQLQVHVLHPTYCHVQCVCTPSMKPGKYKVYILLDHENDIVDVKIATCECAAG